MDDDDDAPPPRQFQQKSVLSYSDPRTILSQWLKYEIALPNNSPDSVIHFYNVLCKAGKMYDIHLNTSRLSYVRTCSLREKNT